MPHSRITDLLESQREALFLWMPVFFAAGIAGYFANPAEPAQGLAIALVLLGAGLVVLRPRDRIGGYVLASALGFGLLGYGYAALRSETARAPVLRGHYYGPIEGRIINLDRSGSNAPRVLLDRLYLPGIAARETPERARVSLQGFIADTALEAGARITLTGRLSPPGPPVEPGGFDFRRMAWFMRLGAVGYTRNPALRAAPPEGGADTWVFRQRMRISRAIMARIAGQKGAFTAAILTGDRSGIDPGVMQNLRRANLAHLLAISGLHMGLLSGFVFALVRYGLALVPALALRVPVKKWAAAVAILAGFGYLVLSGANVATQRAFVMTLVVLVSVLLDRPAFTMRAVAVAAFIVLILKPYNLIGPGFQMSFAATAALIWVYEGLRGNRMRGWLERRGTRWLKPVLGVVLTSAVAGAATAPFSAFYFNQISQTGLLANFLAVPVMGAVVMPLAVLAGLLAPLGLEGLPLWGMGKGVAWILAVADGFGAPEGAVRGVKSAPPVVLALLGLAYVILFLWRGRGRLAGVALLLLALSVWIATPRPQILVAQSGKLAGVAGDNGRNLSRARGDGYSAKIWLENDGDKATQAEAFARGGFVTQGKLAVLDAGDWRVLVYRGKTPLAEACEKNTLLVAPFLEQAAGECLFINAAVLQSHGALGARFTGAGFEITGSKDAAGNRPWGY